MLCLLLMIFAATAEARHFHGSSSRDAQRCGVCVVAHSPTLLARTAIIAPVRVTQPLATVKEAPVVPALALESHSIRPPPAPRSA